MEILRSSLKFERNHPALSSMRIGRRVQIEQWLEEMEVENWTINEDWTIDIEGSVYLINLNLENFPSFIQFGRINGYFFCYRNKLTSLRGSPFYTKKAFYCNNNRLRSLEGISPHIGGDLNCSQNYSEFKENYIKSLSKIDGGILK